MANRFYVDRAIADEFTHRLAKRLGALRIGRGADASVDLGPMIGDRQRARLQGLVTDAVARGARIALEGGSLPGVGHFLAPVVLVDVPDDARVMREEIFGPIAPVNPVDGEADAVARANRCDQGLAGYVDTRDLDAALRVSDAQGRHGCRQPGARLLGRRAVCGTKESGYGTSGGPGALEDSLDTHVVSIGRPGT